MLSLGELPIKKVEHLRVGPVAHLGDQALQVRDARPDDLLTAQVLDESIQQPMCKIVLERQGQQPLSNRNAGVVELAISQVLADALHVNPARGTLIWIIGKSIWRQAKLFGQEL